MALSRRLRAALSCWLVPAALFGCAASYWADEPARPAAVPDESCSAPESGAQFTPIRREGAFVAARGLGLDQTGRHLAIAAADRSLRLFDLTSGRQRATVRRDAGANAKATELDFGVAAARIGADGSVVVTTPTGATAELLLAAEGGWLIVDPTGRFDGAPSTLDRVRLVDGNGGRSLPLRNLADPYFEPSLLGRLLAGTAPSLTATAPSLTGGVPAPPTVTVTVAPANAADRHAGGAVAQVSVRAEDRGGCIGRVTLFHNGKAFGGAPTVDRSGRTPDGRALRDLTYRVPLAQGTNRFEAVAASKLKIEGDRAGVTMPAEGGRAKPVLHLVAVGIDQYAHPALTLAYAVADARSLVESLGRPGARAVFSAVNATLLTDREADRSRILTALDGLRGAAPDDVVVVILAGHGENDGERWYFLPTEFGTAMTLPAVRQEGLSSLVLRDALAAIGARRVLVLIDACKSGQLRSAFGAAADEKYLEWVGRTAGVHILAGTAKDQLAVELGRLGHGAFTYTLLQGLAGAADRRRGDDGLLVSDLLAYTDSTLPALALKFAGFEQVPTVLSFGEDFALAPGKR